MAEVLITLAIIGVVAAMTMPVLVANYKKNVLLNQLRKALSVYSQNLQKTVMIDFDGNAGCYYSTEGTNDHSNCVNFFDKFAANMKVIKTCKGNALSDGCVPVYDFFPGVSGGCGWYNAQFVNTLNTTYVLNDGSIMVPYGNGNDRVMPLFLFDTNGFKGPNKVGSDVFSIDIRQNQSTGAVSFSDTLISCLPAPANAPFKTLKDIMGQ